MGYPKIIVVATTVAPELGGIARSVPLLADCLARESTSEVVLLAYGRPPFAEEYQLVRTAQKEVYPTSRGLLCALKQHIGSSRGGVVVHYAGVWTMLNLQVHRCALRGGAKVVCSPRSMLDPWALCHRRLKKKIAYCVYAKRMLSQTTAIHTTSELERENVVRLHLNRPIITIPNGISFPKEKSKPQLHLRGLRHCLFLSRLSPKKGLPDLLRAFASIDHSTWVLDVVGNPDGVEDEEARHLACSLGIENRVNFLGFLEGDRKWEVYRSASLFALPTYSENFGLVVGEAMACGVPVLTTNAAPWEVLTRINAGWSVDPGVDALKPALREAFFMTPEELRDMGQRGQDYVYEHFSWEQVGRQMLKAYAFL